MAVRLEAHNVVWFLIEARTKRDRELLREFGAWRISESNLPEMLSPIRAGGGGPDWLSFGLYPAEAARVIAWWLERGVVLEGGEPFDGWAEEHERM